MYSKIQALIDGKFQDVGFEPLNLNEWVPLEYIELVYDASIQLITAIDFAHNSKLIHGQLDLSKVKINRKLPSCQTEENASKSPYENLEFEITDFAPKSSIELLDTNEAH